MKPIVTLFFILFSFVSLNAQEKGTGMIFDPPTLRGIPYKAKLTASSYGKMPASASLEKYCPTTGNQGRYSTYVAFAVGIIYGLFYMQKLKANLMPTAKPVS